MVGPALKVSVPQQLHVQHRTFCRGCLPPPQAPAPLPAHPGAPRPPQLLHRRARTKRIMGVKNLDIYALALYVDQGAARRELQGRFRGASATSLATDQTLFDGEQGGLRVC